MARTSYWSIGFGQPGCIPDGTPTVYSGNRRKDLRDSLLGEIEALDLPKTLMREISLERLWRHAKRHGLSSISLEYSTPSMKGCLMLMGLTQEEYERAMEAEGW